MTTDQLTQINHLSWPSPQKPAEIAESRLVESILDGTFPIDSSLPGERELADLLGVTRPTLREALQRLACDGWVEIQHGKPTRVRNYWQEGSLGVLNTLARYPKHLPDNFIPDLLTVRLAMAPAYTAMAVTNTPAELIHLLDNRHDLDDNPEAFAQFDWEVHHQLTIHSQNPAFVMIMNGFKDLYLQLAPLYFQNPSARQHSMNFYQDLAQACERQDPNQARILTDTVMRESLIFWQQVNF